jgi:hypothetical protein
MGKAALSLNREILKNLHKKEMKAIPKGLLEKGT